MKLEESIERHDDDNVTLHARVWIEIIWEIQDFAIEAVTLHARVWIEITFPVFTACICACHPPREGVD